MERNIWGAIIEQFLVRDSSISELQYNGGTSLFARKNGRRVEIQDVFRDEEEFNENIEHLVRLINPAADFKNLKYLEEGRLKLEDGNTARVHIVFPPASDMPQVTIAKKTTDLTTLDKIAEMGSMSQKMADFIKAAVDCKMTIVFSGSTGSGKTTMMEAITKLIDPNTRIGVVEDAPELRLIQNNVTYLHSKPWRPGMNPNDEVTLDWCTRQINRMRTDLLIIGETRGKEFKEFITAANSGMEGSMTTLHANNPKAALRKMTQFVMEAQPQPNRTINKAISTTVDLIIQLHKTVDGKYKCIAIEEISEILGRDEQAEIATTPLTEWLEDRQQWSDDFLISDKLRKRLEDKGYDSYTFHKRASRPLFGAR